MQKKQELEPAKQEPLTQPPKLKFFKSHPLEEELVKAPQPVEFLTYGLIQARL